MKFSILIQANLQKGGFSSHLGASEKQKQPFTKRPVANAAVKEPRSWGTDASISHCASIVLKASKGSKKSNNMSLSALYAVIEAHSSTS